MSNAVDSITVKGRNVTSADVEAAIAECDAMGQAAFLSHYGFRPSQTYWLRGPKTHRPYPSKAILAVAARCTRKHGYTGQFFGGAAHTVNSLNRLGFQVRDGNAPVRSAGVDALREAAIAAGFNDPAPEWKNLPTTPVAAFASGSNTAKVIRATAAARMDVGVAADEVRAASEAELVKLAGTDVQVFVDSGAFGEVKFPGGVPTVVKPINDDAWQKRLGLYQRLGNALGEQAWVVAPDQVGSQEVTLERLERYRSQLAEIADTGATVMVVAQRGVLTQAEFYRKAVKVAGLEGRSNVIPALPCKSAATSPAEAAAFVADLKPDHVHCLGLGPTNQKIRHYMAAFAGTETSVSLDACWIKANAGKANPEKRRKERRYTKAQRFAAAALDAAGKVVDLALKLEVAMLLCLGAPLPTLVAAGQQFTLFAA